MGSKNKKPTMLFDGDCNFCRSWIERWKKITGNKILYVPYQKAIINFPQLTREECKKSVQLILPNGKVYSGAHAAFKTFSLAGRYTWLLWIYEHVPFACDISEIAYRWITQHR